MSENRKKDRTDGATYCELTIEIQSGFEFKQTVAKLVDFSETGAQFRSESGYPINKDDTILIHTKVGNPPKKLVIEGVIAWLSDEGGQKWFGVKFFKKLEELPTFHS